LKKEARHIDMRPEMYCYLLSRHFSGSKVMKLKRQILLDLNKHEDAATSITMDQLKAMLLV
jgi:hypothetical protein